MTEEVFDVVLQSTGAFHADLAEFSSARPPQEEISLGMGIWVGRLPHGVKSDLVFDACSPAGHNFRPTRQFGCRYAICRKVEPSTNENYYEWDSDGWLGRTLFASRFVRPTTISTHLSAKLYFIDGTLNTIVPGRVSGVGTYAFVVAKDDWRDWLSVREFEVLRETLSNYILTPPERVRHARRHIDHAFHSFYLDQRCASSVTGFESLLKISQYRSGKQFALRAPNLAKALGLELTAEESNVLYEDRSAFVHGTPVSFSEVSDELITQYNRFEHVLRCALLKASTDARFAALFSSDHSIEREFGTLTT